MSIIMTGLFKCFIRLRSWMLKVKTEPNANSLFPKVYPCTLGHRNHRMHSAHKHCIKMQYFVTETFTTPIYKITQWYLAAHSNNATVLHAASPETFGSHLKR